VRRRLDVELVRRGLAASRAEAGEQIRSGNVIVGGRPVAKASTLVAPEDPVSVAGPGRRFVSRGGQKLEAALDRFDIDVRGLDTLDVGASTGGFTDCLLRRGAARVAAVDVGYGQLDWSLRQDPRVSVMERTNVRSLSRGELPFVPRVLVVDVSFISLRLVIPVLATLIDHGAHAVLLVKPQFEAGRDRVTGGGVVRDPEVWRSILSDVAVWCADAELRVLGMMASPVLGPAGNAEFLLAAVAEPASATAEPPRAARIDLADLPARAVAEARSLTERNV
jgi:23S rRNA (cytidine1920-2'-O)/16S rRNA (cytidine1409-2'-O)-methyltransferase